MHTPAPKDVDILKSLSDSKSLEMFRSVARENVGSEELIRGLSRKQYYFRMGQLLKAGLVQRIKGRFSPTCLGAVVNHAELVIESGANIYWKLKASDSIQVVQHKSVWSSRCTTLFLFQL